MNDVVKIPETLIPLSHLALDLESPSIGGWAAYLRGRGLDIVRDDLGRDAISRANARMLMAERIAAEQRQREYAEAAAMAAEEQRLASLRPGIPASHMPPGVAPAAAMLQAGTDASRQTQSQGEWMFGEEETMVYHSYAETADES